MFWKYDSLLGWRHQPGQQGIFESPHAFRTKVSINSKGLRDQEYPYARIPGRRRVLVLGDSFTWGFGVEQQETFTEVLENMLDNVEVINAGVSGYSTDQELLWFKTEGVKYHPDLVILAFCGNDDYMNSLDLVYDVYYKPRFRLDSADQLILQNVPVPTASSYRRIKLKLRQHSALINYLIAKYDFVMSKGTRKGTIIEHNDRPFGLTLKLLGEMRGMANEFMIVSFSTGWRSAESYPELISSLEASPFLVLDVDSCVGYSAEQMQLPGEVHWNRIGHQFIAEQIFRFISDKGVL